MSLISEKLASQCIGCRTAVEARIGEDQYGQKGFLVALNSDSTAAIQFLTHLPAAPGASQNLLLEPAGVREANYLRAAQAYILISMPTGTSTIFGHFQAIRELPSPRHDCRSKIW